MIAAGPRRVETVDIVVILEEDTTVPARDIISEETALVSCTSICIMFKICFFNTYIYSY